jgi:molybdopterin-guanine dinucleotide biosynthesis protein B
MRIVAIVGPSGSGKTRLITRLVPEFTRRGLRAAVIKRCGHGFLLDLEGKDSWQYRRAGASGVVLTAPDEIVVLTAAGSDTDPRDLARRYLGDAEVVLIEGGKSLRGLPKVEILRGELGGGLLTPPGDLLALVADAPPADAGYRVFGPDEAPALAEFLLERLEEDTMDIRLQVDGKAVELNPFARKIVENTVLGMVKSLSGVPETPRTISLEISRRDSDREKS